MTKTISFSSFALALIFSASVALAQEPNITFPIDELGGCSSKEECKTYCDTPSNAERCVSFAEEYGLMSSEEAERARKFAGQTGPGGCMGSECRTYCSDTEHRDECVQFAKEHNLTPPGGMPPRMGEVDIDEPEIDEGRAMQVLQEQGGPGGCKTKDECHAFCEVEENMATCLAFAEEHNLMSQEDLARARNFVGKPGPGGCRGATCRAYCESPDHREECLAFAEENGFIKPEEAERARKLINATGPGGCRGEECRTYCEDRNHANECLRFAVENGFISEEEGERHLQNMQDMQRQDGPRDQNFSGPGGCQNEEECREYCEANPDECGKFEPPGGGEPNDFGQQRAIDERGFVIPPGKNLPPGGLPTNRPCSSLAECRRLYEEHKEQFMGEVQGGEGMQGEINSRPYGGDEDRSKMKFMPGYSGENDERPPFEGQYQGQFQGYKPMPGDMMQDDRQYQQNPPPGGPPPMQYGQPSGEYRPSETYQSAPSTNFAPPPGEYHPPSDSAPPPSFEGTREPTSLSPAATFVAAVSVIFNQLLGL